MNWNLKRALKRLMPTDAEMEAMDCRYLTDEELDVIFGGRPDDGDINDACPPGGNFGGGYSGGSSSGDSSDSGSSGSFSGDSSSGDNGGQSGASENSSNSDNSSSKDYSIQPGDTLAGITHDHYPDLTGQDFVDKVNEIAAANGIDDIDNIQAGATISIPGGSGGSSSSGASGASGVGGGSNEHCGNDGEHGGSSEQTGTTGVAGGTAGGTGTTGKTPTRTTPTTEEKIAKTNTKDEKSSKGGLRGFFADPIGTTINLGKNIVGLGKAIGQAALEHTYSFGWGAKGALIGGLGLEVEVSFNPSEKKGSVNVTGSVGCGIQVPATTKTGLSTSDYLGKSIGKTKEISGSVQTPGFSTSRTAEIGLGITGTYDLDNLNKSGLPNSWGAGSVGGGVWHNGTVSIPFGWGSK